MRHCHEKHQAMERADEGRRINRGFAFLAEHSSGACDEGDSTDPFKQPIGFATKDRHPVPRSTPWETVAHPRYTR